MTDLQIMSRDNQARLGSIIRKWDNHLGDFMLHVRFPASGISEFYKALLLAAAILIVSASIFISNN